MANFFDQFDTTEALAPAPPVAALPPTPNFFDQFDATTPTVAPVPDAAIQAERSGTTTPQPSIIGEVGGAFQRGQEQFSLLAPSARYALGMLSAEDFAKEASASRKRLAAIPKSVAVSEAEAAPFLEKMRNPHWWAETVGGAIPATAATIATSLGGAAAGSPVGPVGATAGGLVGLGVGAGALEFGPSVLEYLEKKGVDTQDERALALALQDKDLVNEALWFGAKRAGVSGVLNAMGGAVGGKVAPMFFRPGATFGRKVVGTGALSVTGGAASGVAEAGAELASEGKIDPNRVLETTAVGTAMGAPTLIVPAVTAVRQAAGKIAGKAEASALPTATPPKAAQVRLDERGVPVLDPAFVRERVDFNDPMVADAAQIAAAVIEALPERGTAKQWMSVVEGAVGEKSQVAAKIRKQLEVLPETLIRKDQVKEAIAPWLVRASTLDNPISPLNGKTDVELSTPGAARSADGTSEAALPIKQTVSVASALDDSQRPTLMVKADRPLSAPEAQRLVDLARDNGYERIAWQDTQPALAKTGTAEAVRVREEFGSGRSDVQSVRIESQASEPVLRARSAPPPGQMNVGQGGVGQRIKTGAFKKEDVQTFAGRAAVVVKQLAKQFGFTDEIKIVTDGPLNATDPMAWGSVQGNKKQGYTINLHPENHGSLAGMYTTLAHELGHVISWSKLKDADTMTQIAIMAEYGRFLHRAVNSKGEGLQRLVLLRDSVGDLSAAQLFGLTKTLGANSAAYQAYWLSFQEWFAQQVARWATTDVRPLSVVDKFFAGLSKAIGKVVSRLYRYAGVQLDASPAVKEWLNGFMDGVDAGAFATIYEKIDMQTMLDNRAAMSAVGGKYVDAVEQTASTGPGRGAIGKLFSGRPPKELRAVPAFADKMNRFYDLMTGLFQLKNRNTHVRDLVLYTEKIKLADLERVGIVNAILPTIKAIKRLGVKQRDALYDMLDDYDQMRYLNAEAKAAGVERMPTPEELAKLARDAGASPETVQLFDQMRRDYAGFLDKLEEVLKYEAAKLPLHLQAERLAAIEEQIGKLRSKPYNPHLRFGKYVVVVRTPKGEVVASMQAETKAQQGRVMREAQAEYPAFEVSSFVTQESALPLRGMPPGLLRMLLEKLDLDPNQKELAQALQFELAPIQSFKHRLQRRKNLPGYSTDFLRAYASYFMHGANYLVRAKYADELQGHVLSTHEQSRFMPDGNKRAMLANYMSKHLRDWLDPKADFYKLKAVTFFIMLGFNVKSALTNLTSLPARSYPELAAGFGDVSSAAALLRAGADLSTYYRKATLDKMTAPRLRMLTELYNEGVVTEALAPMVAGVAEGRNLTEKYAGSPTNRAFQWLAEKSSSPFQMTEQMIRRITAVAAFDLAMKRPDVTYVKEAIAANPVQFQRLVERGFNPVEAAAITTAKHAVEVTQGIYNRSARPTFMRGKKGAFFQFQSFKQDTLWNMWNHPAAGVRSMIVFAAMGGLLGVPFAEDVIDMLRVLGWQIFGKDFNLEREARQMLIDHFGTTAEEGDLLMHGTSRFGFGIPALMDLMGLHSFSPDVSGTGLGPISPVPVDLLFGPQPDADKAIAQGVQRAAGAPFGLGFALYRAITDPSNEQAWLRLVPRVMGNAYKAYDAYQTGEVRRPDGSVAVRLDPSNAEDMAEIIAMGMGYTSTDRAQMQEKERAIYEVTSFWDMRRETLMRQFSEAVRSDDKEDKAQMIAAVRKFNAETPFKAKRITTDDLKRSVENRAKRLAKRSAGVATNKRDAGIMRDVGRLYPEAEPTARQIVK